MLAQVLVLSLLHALLDVASHDSALRVLQTAQGKAEAGAALNLSASDGDRRRRLTESGRYVYAQLPATAVDVVICVLAVACSSFVSGHEHSSTREHGQSVSQGGQHAWQGLCCRHRTGGVSYCPRASSPQYVLAFSFSFFVLAVILRHCV